MKKKFMVFAMALSLFCGALAGCGKADGETGGGTGTQGGLPGSGGQESQKGGYTEKEITLPDGLEASSIVMLERERELLKVYFREENEEETGLRAYTYDGKSGWTEVTPVWMQEWSLPSEAYISCRVLRGKDDREYLFAAYIDPAAGDNYVGHLFAVQDGQEPLDITPAEWMQQDEEFHFYDVPTDLTILNNGLLAVRFYSRTVIYDLASGEKKWEKDDYESTERIYGAGEKYALVRGDFGGELKGIEVYTPGEEEPERVCEASQENGGDTLLDILEDGTLIAANRNGFFRMPPEAEQTGEPFITGSDTSLCDLNLWCQEIKAVGETYYALFYGTDETGGNAALMQYVYDPELERLPALELTLYTLYESYTLQQAAVLYHKLHPEVVIRIETALSYEEQYAGNADMDDIKTRLNAELIAGKAADLFVLDDLDIHNLAEKGLLADINDVVEPLERQGDLLENITGIYRREDGSRYAVPLKFSLNLFVGNEIDTTAVHDMKSLAEALSGEENSMLGVMTVEDLVDTFAPYFISEIIQGKQLDTEALAEYLGYLKTIAENCGIVREYSETAQPGSIFSLPSLGAVFCRAEGFQQAMTPLSAAKLVKGTWNSFQGTFTPGQQIGINARSEHIDIARDFVAFALSEQAQESDFYDGFSVNARVLGRQKERDRSDSEAFASVMTADGGFLDLEIKAYSPEEADRLMELCRNLSHPAERDSAV
ncbi:MAG: extracellular solute-binding protein, partial [Lachnospiraceae bacterium]|nr:extracellular solute-binding protein [Lachnospiraceae bacterium]